MGYIAEIYTTKPRRHRIMKLPSGFAESFGKKATAGKNAKAMIRELRKTAHFKEQIAKGQGLIYKVVKVKF